MKIKKIEKLLIFVNSGMDRPYSQYASYVVAFTAKKIHNIPEVMVYYGPQGVEVAKKGNLAKLACSEVMPVKIPDAVEAALSADKILFF